MSSRAATLAAFGLVLVLLVLIEGLARRKGSRIPTAGDLCGYVMRYTMGRVPLGRIAVLGFWWWVGWHFFAR